MVAGRQEEGEGGLTESQRKPALRDHEELGFM